MFCFECETSELVEGKSERQNKCFNVRSCLLLIEPPGYSISKSK